MRVTFFTFSILFRWHFVKYISQKVIYNTQKPPFTGWHDDLSSFFADDEDRKGARPDVGGNDGAQGHDEDLVDG